MLLEPVEDTQDGGVGADEGVVMAGIADNNIGVGEGGDVCCLIDGLLELGDIGSLFGGNRD